MQLELTENATPIEVEIKRSDRRKTWSLSIKPGGEVLLAVPQTMSQSKIDGILEKYREWILKRFEKYRRLPRIDLTHAWREGQDFYYQGRQLKIAFARSNFPSVLLEEEKILVHAKDFRATYVKKIVELWLEETTQRQAGPLLEKWAERFGLREVPPLKLRVLKRSWGQCRSDGRITLHKYLCRLHPEFFEYVVVHELCHIFHLNHGPHFKALLASHLPHWKEIKKKHEPMLLK